MLRNLTTGEILATRVHHCNSLLSRARGVMLRRSLREDEVLIFSEGDESVVFTTITMLFVFFPIAVLWLDGEKQVVDKRLARPFRLWYAPARPARYYVEGHPSLLDRVEVGHYLSF